ncbi:hypothetical protein ACFDTO_36585 [Microbacteriaceae bacterium 4G12]
MLKNDVSRLFTIDRMPQLEVRIPSKFTGKIIVDGFSGSAVGKELQTHNLQVKEEIYGQSSVTLHTAKAARQMIGRPYERVTR